MTKLYVAEYPGLAATNTSDGVPILPMPPTAEQVVDYTAGAAPTVNPFADSTIFVELEADSICSIAFGTAPVATVLNMRMAAGERRVVGVPRGSKLKVSAITNT